uniref:hypothetical protein n=1 Tax=uncultured Chryseobacterium sp. TaxID=259322 RepID=UPI0025F6C8A9
STRSYAQSYLGQNSQQGGGSAEVIAKMIALGGDWYNTGYGFADTAKIGLAYDGSYTSLNTALDGYTDLPELTINASRWYYAFTGNYFSKNGKKSIFNHLDKHIGTMATISEWELDTMEKWASSDNIALKFSYGIANNAYITAQIFDFGLMERPEWKNPLGGNYGNLDGTPNYQQTDAFMKTILTLVPYGRGAIAARTTLPEGIVLLNRFDSAPGIKGTIYNMLNKGVDYINQDAGKGLKALTIAKFIGTQGQPNSALRKWIKKNVGYRSEFY